MKVCMVAYSFYEEDNRVRRYAEALAERGDQVDAFSLRKEGQAVEDVIKGVHIYRKQRRVVNESSKFTYLLRLILFLFRSMFFLTRKQLSGRYDLIHVHSVPDFEVFAALIPRLTGTKVILDIHDLVPEFYSSKFSGSKKTLGFRALVFVERMSAAFSSHVIAANHIWQKRLEERSVKPPRCTTFLNYPDTSIFKPRGRTRADEKFIMLYPGTLNYHQGLDIAVRAFSLIEKRVPQAEFHIYGAGEQVGLLKSLIAELGLSSKVFLRDKLPLSSIAALMENADLGVVPKRNNNFGNEAFSTKIFEFMAVGTPVIVPDTMIDSYYFNGSVVKFFKANDENSLAEAMITLIDDKEARTLLARNASEFIRKYTWDTNKGQYLSLVDSLVGAPNRVARAAL